MFVCIYMGVYRKIKKGSLRCDYSLQQMHKYSRCSLSLKLSLGYSFDSFYLITLFGREEICLYLQIWTINHFLLSLNFYNLNLKTSSSAFGCPTTATVYWSYSMLKGLVFVFPSPLLPVSHRHQFTMRRHHMCHLSLLHTLKKIPSTWVVLMFYLSVLEASLLSKIVAALSSCSSASWLQKQNTFLIWILCYLWDLAWIHQAEKTCFPELIPPDAF